LGYLICERVEQVEQAKVEFRMIYRRQTLAWEATDVTLAYVGLP
jgi:hypothetical protein